MAAFAAYSSAECLEHCPTSDIAAFSLTRAVTSGVKTLIGKSGGHVSGRAGASGSSNTLPDGRLKVGIHLPLLARRFRYLRLIGEGTSAQVILAEDTYSGNAKLVVIKVLRRQFGSVAHKEIQALRFLHAQDAAWQCSLVKLLSAFTYYGHVCLVLERLHGSLLDYVVHSAGLQSPQALLNFRKIAVQLLGTLAMMHSKGVTHADIKPENILLTSPPDSGRVGVKLIDLGNCISLNGTDTSRISFEMQTLPFRAPEALVGTACGTGIDVWSLGCVLAEVALQRPLFPVTTTAELVYQMTSQLGPMPESFTTRSNPALHSASLDPGAQALPPTFSQTACHTQGTTRGGKQPPQHCHQGRKGLFSPQAGALSMWHERVCPLQLELSKVDPGMASMVMSMLQYNPQARSSAAQALRHPFLQGLSPVLQLPQERAEGTAELPVAGSGDRAGAFTQAEAWVPFKSEPQRQMATSLPKRSSPAKQTAAAPCIQGTLPVSSTALLTAQESVQPPQLGIWQPPPGLTAHQPPQLGLAQRLLQPQPGSPVGPDSQVSTKPGHRHPPPPAQLFSAVAKQPEQQLCGQLQVQSTGQPTGTHVSVQASVAAWHAHHVVLASSQAIADSLQSHTANQAAARVATAGHKAVTPMSPSIQHTIVADSTDSDSPPQAVASPAQLAGTAVEDLSSASGSDLPQPASGLLESASGTIQPLRQSPQTNRPSPPEAALAAAQGSGISGVQRAQHADHLSRAPQHSPVDLATGVYPALNKVVEKAWPSPQAPAKEVGLTSGLGETPGGVTHLQGETAQGMAQTLDDTTLGVGDTPYSLARGSGQTPGVVKAWNGVAYLLDSMTPASEVKPPPRSLSQALQAAEPPKEPHTTPPSQPAPLHAQTTSAMESQQQLQQQMLDSNKAFPADAAMADEGRARQTATAPVPSCSSPTFDQKGSLQGPSHASPSHVSQSMVSCKSHGSALYGSLDSEQQSRQEHVTNDHMQPQNVACNGTCQAQGSPAALPAAAEEKAVCDQARARALEPAGATCSPAPTAAALPSGKRRKLSKQAGPQLSHQEPKQQLMQELAIQSSNQKPNLEQISRAGSRAASAVPAESQQSAVHALLPAAQSQAHEAEDNPAQAQASKPRMLLDDRAGLRRAKRQRPGVNDGVQPGAKAKTRVRPRANAAPDTEEVIIASSQDAKEEGQPDIVSVHSHAQQSGMSECHIATDLSKSKGHGAAMQRHDGRVPQTRSADAKLHADDDLGSGRRQAGIGDDHEVATIAAPAVKRHTRSRDSDANKPWWVV